MRFFFCLCVSLAIAAIAQAGDDKVQAERDTASITTKKAPATSESETVTQVITRSYPGGRDEEDLKVQDTLVPPTIKIDRRTIEAKVLKGNVKVDSDEPEASEQ